MEEELKKRMQLRILYLAHLPTSSVSSVPSGNWESALKNRSNQEVERDVNIKMQEIETASICDLLDIYDDLLIEKFYYEHRR